MRPDTEAHLALHRLAQALASLPVLDSVYGMMVGTTMHVWVVLHDLSRPYEEAVFDAQIDTDPDFWLVIHLTDSPDTVPANAEKVDMPTAV
ncbi:hypothetical protein [Sulfobacillus thermosulfidooxidans]|uniref:hypothetical protein n=1 Tax=Sulfobacillus thermosulfidooxidans TaxID=28034 RepID=UPI0006B55F71|nr:hypothetical protein [Sulfobacillus thermosulfidooxidans]